MDTRFRAELASLGFYVVSYNHKNPNQGPYRDPTWEGWHLGMDIHIHPMIKNGLYQSLYISLPSPLQ